MDRNHELSHRNSFISRNSRGGVVASAAYLAREGRTEFDPETGEAFKRFDYSGVSHHAAYAARREAFGGHDDLAFVEVRLPPGAPAWARDGQRLWNALEAQENAWADRYYRRRPELAEKHKSTARLAMKGHISLARGLDREAAIEAAREIIDRKFVARGQAVEWALHWKEGQPHLHYVASARVMTDEGFGKQARWTAANGREYAVVHLPKAALGEWAKETREIAAEAQNRMLAERGISRRVEHLSFAARGLDVLPGVHAGPGKERAAAETINTERRSENARRAVEKPAEFVRSIFANDAVLSEAAIKNSIFQRVEGDEIEFEAAWRAIQPEIVGLGDDVSGRAVFTSHEYQDAEAELLRHGAALTSRRSPAVSGLADAIASYEVERGFALNTEQRNALRHVVGEGDMALVVGRAGTGKTTIMEVARHAWQADGRRVRGFATAAIAADNLQREAGIESTTIAKFLHNYRRVEEARAVLADASAGRGARRRARFTVDALASELTRSGDVLVIDEAGMIGTRELRDVLARAEAAGAKVVMIGDHEQLSSVSAGQAFRALHEQHGAAVLADIRRQREAGDRAASIALTEGRVAEALEHYRSKGAVRFADTRAEAQRQMVAAYLAARDVHGAAKVTMTAVRNADVIDLNAAVRGELRERGELGVEAEIAGRSLAVDDEIVFLENTRSVGVMNGTRARVTAIVRDDDGEAVGFTARKRDGRVVVIDYRTDKTAPWAHGYATTVHKAQGQTVEWAGHYAAAESRSAALVALTRHRGEAVIFADRETYAADFADLAREVSRDRRQELAADYSVSPNREPARERVTRYLEVCRGYAATMAEAGEVADRAGESIFNTEKWEHARELAAERRSLACELAAKWDDHRTFARQAGVRRTDIEQIADPSRRVYAEVEIEARARVREFAPLAAEARDRWNQIKATHPGAASREHPRFAEYDDVRQRRDAAAVPIAADRRLHAQFARDAGITWTSIQSQAAAHVERQAEAECVAAA
ncbi:MAG: AAA family ATPase, partial [Alphaproteobacteria bacterium]|nr:AAA family ATPase [Alphaproteobacteria bacterium]